jgi:TonB family protein
LVLFEWILKDFHSAIVKAHLTALAPMLVVVPLLLALIAPTATQSAPLPEGPKAEVVLVKLSPPIYPPLARQASITGDVKVRLWIQKGGTIQSAEAVSGHPMLKMAALESAQKSHFECRGCADPVAYVLTYRFVVKKFSTESCKLAPKNPEVSFSDDHVTITAEALCVVAN